MGMRLTRTAPILIGALALLGAGCGQGSVDVVPVVHAHGQVTMVGGPAPGAPIPVENATVQLTGGHSYVAHTDATGRFQVDAFPGHYQVGILQKSGGPLRPVPDEVTVTSPDKPLNIVIPIK